MNSTYFFGYMLGLATAFSACGGTVESFDRESEDPGAAHSIGESPGDSGGAEHAQAIDGIPCKYLHGQATLTSYYGDKDNYASSAFSFEFASQDPAVTKNEFDVQYANDLFIVNMITDDLSFIVDLGNVPFDNVPPTVDPDDYPVGNWGEHDALQAQIHHTYLVRSEDAAGRGMAAFRVQGLEPGIRVTIDWVRSTDPDEMVLPVACGL